MRYGHTMMRNILRTFAAVTMLGVAGACSDTTTVAPVAETAKVFAPANFTQVGSVTLLQVNNSEGIIARVGSHVLYVPAYAICDLLTSGYGAATWDQPCYPMRGSITITATEFIGPNGEPYIDFQPAMRFAPNKEVMIFFREGRTDGTKQAAVKYCNNLGWCVDESLTDPSLKPFRITGTSIIGRRVKHFTGYTVTYEFECDGVATPTGDGNYYCEPGTGTGVQRRSGYMVASGENVVDIMSEKDDRADKKKDEQ